MGMVDSSLRLSAAQAVTGLGDIASTGTLDLGTSFQDMGLTSDLWAVAVCTAAATSAGAATVQAALQDSANGSTWADLLLGPVLPVASAKPGVKLLETQPPNNHRRYLRMVYRIGTAALTGGQFDAFITTAVQRNASKPSGFAVV